MDGNPIQDLDLCWLRQHVGVVQQEPLLFAGSVADNIRLGRLEASDKEVEEAAKMANAHNFIMKIPGVSTRFHDSAEILSKVGFKCSLSCLK